MWGGCEKFFTQPRRDWKKKKIKILGSGLCQWLFSTTFYSLCFNILNYKKYNRKINEWTNKIILNHKHKEKRRNYICKGKKYQVL